MAKDNSFDIVSEVDLQEIDNSVNMTAKEIATRFDFKGTNSRISFSRDNAVIDLEADDEYGLRSISDILVGKVVKRGVAAKALDFGAPEPASGGTARQTIRIIRGIDQDRARAIAKHVKQSGLKVQVQIEGDRLRVSGKSRDVLQQAIARVKEHDFGLPLQFINYR